MNNNEFESFLPFSGQFNKKTGPPDEKDKIRIALSPANSEYPGCYSRPIF